MTVETKPVERPQDEVDSVPIVYVGLISVILVVTGILGVGAWFEYLEGREVVRRQDQPVVPPEIQSAMNQQEMDLVTYGWIDREKGVVRLPAERAMELLTEERKGRK
jgi:hypothetical protein